MLNQPTITNNSYYDTTTNEWVTTITIRNKVMNRNVTTFAPKVSYDPYTSLPKPQPHKLADLTQKPQVSGNPENKFDWNLNKPFYTNINTVKFPEVKLFSKEELKRVAYPEVKPLTKEQLSALNALPLNSILEGF